ncbi:Cytosolic Fe-S cluster assembly factor NUBP2 like protein [Nosema granulosis]|uniref:Cytosolic Fe-S cluster assembly factor NUBP2 like protein n=1 Tax=Nosema granulosis TaxID=83296 RepID=A0A9P6H1J8_9MICR|nr:Cytosolic Fe-S cluster assembly factor NUBP2 like protein [Nosema granulosis]
MKKIAIMSGKGGVGKSSVAISLSLVLSKTKKVLLLDFDLCGPSCVKSLSATGSVLKAEKGLKPIQVTDNLFLISMGSMMSETDSVVWRGPKKLSMLNLFYESIDGYDFIIIDTPPGVSEEHGFLINKGIESIVVTTSQNIALSDSVKAVEFCKNNGIDIIGVIENMSGYKCECCGEINYVFAANGGRLLAERYDLEFLCCLEVDSKFSNLMDSGDLKEKFTELSNSKILEGVCETKLFKSKY